MTTRLLVFLLLLSSFSGHAQITVQGKVVDVSTSEPLGYGTVKVVGSNRGVLTNEDGQFKIACELSDTLLFRYLSYESRLIAAKDFVKNPICELKVKNNQLSTVIVDAEKDYLYDMILACGRKLRKRSEYESKMYFFLETMSEDKPVEQIECYYNASLDGYGITDIGLKNGRIGMTEFEDQYFISLSTTTAIGDYNMLEDQHNYFPTNPLQLNKKQLKKQFSLNLLALDESKYKIGFKGRSKREVFEGELWLDAEANHIISLTLRKGNLKNHPFAPLQKEHKLDRLDYEMTYVFDQKNQRIEKIEVNYELAYNTGKEVRDIETKVVFLMYDFTKTFKLPFYEDETLLSDYDKIVSQPYNKVFWDHNEVVLPSEKTKKHRAFFEENGVLLNFNDLSHKNERLSERKRPWSKERLWRDDLNEETAKSDLVPKGLMITTNAYHQRESKYRLSGQIFLDVNEIDDSLHHMSMTLVDLDKSYFILQPDRYSVFFINSYFDLVEIYRRKMEEKLQSTSWTLSSVDTLYAELVEEMNKELFLCRTKMMGWENREDVQELADRIYDELDLCNDRLILPKVQQDWITDKENYSITQPVEHYWYAYNLLHDGQIDEAIKMFVQYGKFGKHHKWYYLNMGKCFYESGESVTACQFFDLFETYGGKWLDMEYVNACEKVVEQE